MSVFLLIRSFVYITALFVTTAGVASLQMTSRPCLAKSPRWSATISGNAHWKLYLLTAMLTIKRTDDRDFQGFESAKAFRTGPERAQGVRKKIRRLGGISG